MVPEYRERHEERVAKDALLNSPEYQAEIAARIAEREAEKAAAEAAYRAQLREMLGPPPETPADPLECLAAIALAPPVAEPNDADAPPKGM